MEPAVVAAMIAAGVSVLTLIGTLAAQYFGRRATSRDTEKALDRTLTEQRTRTLNERLMALIEIPHLCSAKFLTLGRGQGSGSWPVRVARRLVSARAW